MRHYGLTNKDGEALISTDKLNLALPLCGLVEHHFNISYYEYQVALEQKLSEIHDKLLKYMGFEELLSISDDKLLNKR